MAKFIIEIEEVEINRFKKYLCEQDLIEWIKFSLQHHDLKIKSIEEIENE